MGSSLNRLRGNLLTIGGRRYSMKSIMCIYCKEKTVVKDTEPAYSLKVNMYGEIREITVENLTVLKCPICKNFMLDLEGNNQIDAASRKAFGLLSLEELKQIRLNLNLSIEDLSKKLNIKENLINDWEEGYRFHTKEYDKALRELANKTP